VKRLSPRCRQNAENIGVGRGILWDGWRYRGLGMELELGAGGKPHIMKPSSSA